MADIERELALFKNAIYGEEVRDALISSIRAINNDKTGIVYKGTLGVGGTITSLPTASTSNSGYTYTVITAGTYAGQSANIGDFFTSDGTAWKLTPFSNIVHDINSMIYKDNIEEGDFDTIIRANNGEVIFDSDGLVIGDGAENIRFPDGADITLESVMSILNGDKTKIEIENDRIYANTDQIRLATYGDQESSFIDIDGEEIEISSKYGNVYINAPNDEIRLNGERVLANGEEIALKDNLSFFNANATSHSLDTAEGGIRLNKVEGKTHKSANIANIPNFTISTDANVDKIVTMKSGTTYTLSFNASGVSGTSVQVRKSGETGNDATYTTVAGYNTFTFTTARNCDIVRFYGNGLTISNLMLNEGTTALSYEPYGMWSAGEMGYFDGKLSQGNRTAGEGMDKIITNNVWVSNTNPIEVNPTDILNIKTSRTFNICQIIAWSKDKEKINSQNFMNTNDFSYTVPTDGKYITISFGGGSAVTPSDAGTISITLNNNYALVVEENGKNLWDYSKTNHNFYNYTSGEKKTNVKYLSMGYDTFPIKKGQSVTLSYGTTDSSPWCAVIVFDRNGNFKKNVNISGTTITYTASEDELYSVQVYTTNSEAILGGNVSYIQLEEGNVATPYTEYQGKTVFIPITDSLKSVNDVKDEFCKVSGSWKEHRRLGIVDLGSANWIAMGYGAYVDIANSKSWGNNIVANALSNKYPIISRNEIGYSTPYTAYGIAFQGTLLCVADTSIGGTRTEIQNNLKGQYLIYELATDTYTDVIDETPFYELESYKDKTYIDTADGLASLDVSYSKVDVGATAIGGENAGIKNEVEVEDLKSDLCTLTLDKFQNGGTTSLVRSGKNCVLTLHGYVTDTLNNSAIGTVSPAPKKETLNAIGCSDGTIKECHIRTDGNVVISNQVPQGAWLIGQVTYISA